MEPARSFHQKEGINVIALREVRRFIRDCLVAVQTPKEQAHLVADILTEADYRGHSNEGMNKLEQFINDIKSGYYDLKAKPKLLKESPAVAWVDGCNSLGPVVAEFCMRLSIAKAKTMGVGWVVCKRSNDFGLAEIYSSLAAKEGLLGFCCTNAAPIIAPTRAKDPVLGYNPIGVAAPPYENENIIMGISPTSMPFGKFEMNKKTDEKIPPCVAGNCNGVSTEIYKEAHFLFPLGGTEKTFGYKGYALALLVELFCGILAGSAYGPDVGQLDQNLKKEANIGQCFVAVNPSFFAPEFDQRIQDLQKYIRNMEPVDKDKPILIPGDPEREHMHKVNKDGGVGYLKHQIDACGKLAQKLGVRPICTITGRKILKPKL